MQTKARIFCLGHIKTLLPLLRTAEALKFGNDVNQFQEQGTHALCIAKRELMDYEVSDLLKVLGEVYLKQHELKQNVDGYLIRLCYDMKSLGIIGLQNCICERSSLVIEDLKRNGLKLFVLSQANSVETLTDCIALKLFDGNNKEPLKVAGSTERQVEVSLKSCIKIAVESRDRSERYKASWNNKPNKKNKEMSKNSTVNNFEQNLI